MVTLAFEKIYPSISFLFKKKFSLSFYHHDSFLPSEVLVGWCWSNIGTFCVVKSEKNKTVLTLVVFFLPVEKCSIFWHRCFRDDIVRLNSGPKCTLPSELSSPLRSLFQSDGLLIVKLSCHFSAGVEERRLINSLHFLKHNYTNFKRGQQGQQFSERELQDQMIKGKRVTVGRLSLRQVVWLLRESRNENMRIKRHILDSLTTPFSF